MSETEGREDVKYATKYFAIKTTVGQEKTVANILEARLHGIFLDYMDEPAGMFTITSEKHAAVVFTPPKTTDLIGVEAYIGKKGDPSEPLTACINEYSQETGITETCLGEGRFDPLLLKTEEWIRIKLQNPVKVKRDNIYALVLLKRNAEDGAYEWFYGKESREPPQLNGLRKRAMERHGKQFPVQALGEDRHSIHTCYTGPQRLHIRGGRAEGGGRQHHPKHTPRQSKASDAHNI